MRLDFSVLGKMLMDMQEYLDQIFWQLIWMVPQPLQLLGTFLKPKNLQSH
jgi:hypothetical protein